MCTSYTLKKQLLDKKLIFFMKKGIHIIHPKYQKKYMSPYYVVFYIQYEFMLKARNTKWFA